MAHSVLSGGCVDGLSLLECSLRDGVLPRSVIPFATVVVFKAACGGFKGGLHPFVLFYAVPFKWCFRSVLYMGVSVLSFVGCIFASPCNRG